MFNLPIIISTPLPIVTAIMLLAFTGGIIAVLGEISVKKKMVELVLEGLGAAFATFLIGRVASHFLGVEVS